LIPNKKKKKNGSRQIANRADVLNKSGYRGVHENIVLLPEGVYISSPSENDITLKEILDFTPAEVKTVRLPKGMNFCQADIWKYYMQYQAMNKGRRISQLFRGEDDNYFTVDVQTLRDLIAVNS